MGNNFLAYSLRSQNILIDILKPHRSSGITNTVAKGLSGHKDCGLHLKAGCCEIQMLQLSSYLCPPRITIHALAEQELNMLVH